MIRCRVVWYDTQTSVNTEDLRIVAALCDEGISVDFTNAKGCDNPTSLAKMLADSRLVSISTEWVAVVAVTRIADDSILELPSLLRSANIRAPVIALLKAPMCADARAELRLKLLQQGVAHVFDEFSLFSEPVAVIRNFVLLDSPNCVVLDDEFLYDRAKNYGIHKVTKEVIRLSVGEARLMSAMTSQLKTILPKGVLATAATARDDRRIDNTIYRIRQKFQAKSQVEDKAILFIANRSGGYGIFPEQ